MDIGLPLVVCPLTFLYEWLTQKKMKTEAVDIATSLETEAAKASTVDESVKRKKKLYNYYVIGLSYISFTITDG